MISRHASFPMTKTGSKRVIADDTDSRVLWLCCGCVVVVVCVVVCLVVCLGVVLCVSTTTGPI